MVGVDALWSVALVWMVVEHHAMRRRDAGQSAWVTSVGDWPLIKAR